jgi:hypothetical protein
MSPLEANAGAGATGPPSSGGRYDQFIGHVRFNLPDRQPGRGQGVSLLRGYELVEDAVVGQEARQVVARVFDGDCGFGAEAEFEQQDVGPQAVGQAFTRDPG